MRKAVLFSALLGLSLAKPGGYYHQEYQYKSSSSSFKNNELQHKTDDEGQYSKHGDLEGRTEPKVNSYSQHTEYRNPNSEAQDSSYTQGRQNADFSSSQLGAQEFGQQTDDTYNQNSRLASYGSSDYSSRLNNQGQNYYQQGYDTNQANRRAFGSDSQTAGGSYGQQQGYSYGGSYSASRLNSHTGGGYSAHPLTSQNSHLTELSQQLQDSLSRQLQKAISTQHSQHSSAYSQSSSNNNYNTQLNYDIQELENELKRNLTRQLQEALNRQYGQQGQRGSNSYSLTTSGGYKANANYNNEELADLTQQVEDNLIGQLQEGVRQQYQTQQQSYSSADRIQTRPAQQTVPVEGPSRPAAPSYVQMPVAEATYSVPTNRPVQHTLPNRRPSRPSYVPISGAEATYLSPTNTDDLYSRPHSTTSTPLTDIIKKVQDDLFQQLNTKLAQEERKYSQSSYSYSTSHGSQNIIPNYESEVAYLTEQFKNNLTAQLDEELRRNYGQQIHADDYTYSISSTGARSPAANYRTQDLTNLKQQIENNLLQQLRQRLRQQYNMYIQEGRYLSSSGQQYNTNSDSRPSSYRSPSSGVSNSPSQYDTNVDYTNEAQTHVQRPVHSGSQTSTSTSYKLASQSRNSGIDYTPSSSNSQQQLVDIASQVQNDLSDQVQKALLQQKQFKQYDSEYSSSNVNYNNPQPNYQITLQQLTDDLKRNLTEKLNEGLRRHYGTQGQSSSYSYSVSAGGVYKPTGTYNTQQWENLTKQLQDNLQRQLQEGLSQQYSSHSQSSSSYSASSSSGGAYTSDTGHGIKRNSGAPYYSGGSYTPVSSQNNGYQNYQQHGYHMSYGNTRVAGEDCDMQRDSYYSQHTNHDLTQQNEDDFYGQQNNKDLIQQTEDISHGNGKFQTEHLTQQIKNLTQQTEELNFDRQQSGRERGNPQVTDQQENEDLVEQSEDLRLHQQHTEDDLTQQTEDIGFNQQETEDGFEKLHKNDDLTQQTEDINLNQQTEDWFGKIKVEDQTAEDLSQKTEDSGFNQNQEINQQKTEDLTQQTEDIGFSQQQTEDEFGQLEVDSQQKTEDLTQQTEDIGFDQQTEEGFGKIELGQQTGNTDTHLQPEILTNSSTYAGYRPGQNQKPHEVDYFSQQSDSGYGKLEYDNHHKTEDLHIQKNEDFSQQQSDVHFGQLETANERPIVNLTQQQIHDIHQNHYAQHNNFEKPKPSHNYAELSQQAQDSHEQTFESQLNNIRLTQNNRHGYRQSNINQQSSYRLGQRAHQSYESNSNYGTSYQEDEAAHSHRNSQLQYAHQSYNPEPETSEILEPNHNEYQRAHVEQGTDSSTPKHSYAAHSNRNSQLQYAHQSYNPEPETSEILEPNHNEYQRAHVEQDTDSSTPKHYYSNTRLHYAQQSSNPVSEKTEILEPKSVEYQRAHEVYDQVPSIPRQQNTYNQQKSPGQNYFTDNAPDSQNGENSESENVGIKTRKRVTFADTESTERVPDIEVPPQESEPGFWKKVGGKIGDTLSSAKDKAKSLAETIRSSVG